jgi:hypothetical protein
MTDPRASHQARARRAQAAFLLLLGPFLLGIVLTRRGAPVTATALVLVCYCAVIVALGVLINRGDRSDTYAGMRVAAPVLALAGLVPGLAAWALAAFVIRTGAPWAVVAGVLVTAGTVIFHRAKLVPLTEERQLSANAVEPRGTGHATRMVAVCRRVLREGRFRETRRVLTEERRLMVELNLARALLSQALQNHHEHAVEEARQLLIGLLSQPRLAVPYRRMATDELNAVHQTEANRTGQISGWEKTLNLLSALTRSWPDLAPRMHFHWGQFYAFRASQASRTALSGDRSAAAKRLREEALPLLTTSINRFHAAATEPGPSRPIAEHHAALALQLAMRADLATTAAVLEDEYADPETDAEMDAQFARFDAALSDAAHDLDRAVEHAATAGRHLPRSSAPEFGSIKTQIVRVTLCRLEWWVEYGDLSDEEPGWNPWSELRRADRALRRLARTGGELKPMVAEAQAASRRLRDEFEARDIERPRRFGRSA